ncbi:MAG: efflux RND transporter periplasmic adaptor subunit [Gammaproteobacteria bacterium]|nr:efflux RND transporter periplasmic adaptor subunit [Gammaproteobacteria bacterium]
MPKIPDKKFLLPAGILALALIIAFSLWFIRPEAKKRPQEQIALIVDVIPIEKGDFPVIVQAMGEVAAFREVQLSAQVGGEIVATAEYFAPGGLVKADELLLQIDARDYELELARQQALFSQAQAAYEIEQGRQKNARRDLEVLNRDNPGKTKDTYLVLRGPQLKQAEAELQRARADLDKAKLNLERTQLRAPFNALIVERKVDLGTRVSSQQALATLVDTDEYWIKISVPVDKLPWLESGENGSVARVQMSNGRGVREGYVARIIGRLEEGSRLAPLIVSIKDPLLLQSDNADPRKPLLLGDYVSVILSGRMLSGVYRVPHHFVRNGNIVWTARDQKMAFVPITILHKDRDYVYFNAELQQNERVIISNIATPVDGMPIQVSGSQPTAEVKEISQQGIASSKSGHG